MVRNSSKFVCQQCGYESGKWYGRCPECGNWNSAVETVISGKRQEIKGKSKNASKPVLLASIPVNSTRRVSTKISELDRVLGGGLVPGQVVLIAGEPGIGKSTLLLQVAETLGGKGQDLPAGKAGVKGKSGVLYVSGEESVSQIKIRADRLGVKSKNIQLLEETDVDSIIDAISGLQGASLQGVIIDSIQTMYTSDLTGMSGSVGQVRECAYRLVRFAKENNVSIFIVGHVTKQGSVAGPSVLMHIVDTVLWFEGDKSLTLRLLRAVKNRFGPTDEVGIFSMEDKGLVPLHDPEKLFLSRNKKITPGSVVTCVLEGTRPILVEIQSLIVPNKMVYPKRVAQGLDIRKLELLIAVLQRRCGLPLYEHDVFVNIASGMSIKNDPSADLAICLSIASAYLDKSTRSVMMAIGEVGLLGDIREVYSQEKRVKEAKRLGYSTSITSREVSSLQEAIRKYLQ